MQFLTPLSLWLTALAIPIILLYMLRLRRKQVQVSSTFLWMQVLRDQQANTPWQKLKRNLLLFLQLLILAAIVIALARPAVETPVVASGSVIILLDASASMNATDVTPSRFESARAAVNDLISQLPPASRVTLILVAQTPQTLIASESDKSLLRSALAEAKVSQGEADWFAAFSLAAGAAQLNAEENTTLIVSDGGLPETGLPSLPGETRYVPIGESSDNIGITAMALRNAGESPQLFAEVTNFSADEKVVLVSFYFGDQLITARKVDVPAGKAESISLDGLSKDSGFYSARLSVEGKSKPDSFSLDDAAFAVYQSASARRVLLVSKGNLFLEQLLASLPNVQPFRSLPAQDGKLQIPKDPFDLYILDNIIPAELPKGNILFVNPQTNPLFTVGAPYKDIQAIEVIENQLTQFVNFDNVHILQADAVQVPGWAETLIQTEQGSLVFAGETNSARIASVNFDLRQSDLPLQITYPILFSNLINYLVPPSPFDGGQSLRPGESISITAGTGTKQVAVVTPAQKAIAYNADQTIVFKDTGDIGYYAVNFINGDTTSAEYFAVNLFSQSESNIAPRASIQVGRAEITPTVSEKVGQRELWKWLAVLALIILVIEWQVFHQRQLAALVRTSTKVSPGSLETSAQRKK
jgi:hypothetical protein